MKKILTVLLLLLAATAVKAQFHYDTKYVSASFSGLNLNYSEKGGFQIGLHTEGGYFIDDGLMLRGTFSYNHYATDSDKFSIGGGARYYFTQNGISLGAGLEFTHQSPNHNDLRIPVEIGYTFYLNRYLALEPAVYYKMSINDLSKGSEVGMRVGLGFYF